MGRKHVGAGKHIRLYAAVLICLAMALSAGCKGLLTTEEPAITQPGPVTKPAQEDAETRMAAAKRLFEQGAFQDSVRELDRLLLAVQSGPVAQEALFYLGLNYIHPKNPKRDHIKAAGFFRRIIKNYPRSLLSEQARCILSLQQENEELIRLIDKQNMVIEQLKRVDADIEGKKREHTK